MNFSTWAINKPIPSILFFILVTIAGLIGFSRLPVQYLPETDFPIITVSASLPGATPESLENEVTRRIEDSIASLGLIRHINSTVNEGISVTTVEFELEKNSQEAVSDIRNAIESIRNQLPREMQNPIISKVNVAQGDILSFKIASTVMDELDLSWFVDDTVSKSLLAIKGVGQVTRIGGLDREISIELDPHRLAALNLDAMTISNKISVLLKDVPGGVSRVGRSEQAIRTVGAALTASDIEALFIPVSAGRSIQLSSIATVYDAYQKPTHAALVNAEPAVTFTVQRAKGASEIDTANRVRDKVTELNELHAEIYIEEIGNSTSFIENSYDAAMQTLYEGAILAVIAVLIFLRDWRATAVASVALPLSIIPTFGLIYLLGFQLNTITLLGLTLIIGVLVDDAIVEIENIERHLAGGLAPKEASIHAANEIGLAVIATTFTLVAVFLPTAFMGGLAGEYFKQFGWSASIAVLFSLLVARLLTPMMASVIMKAKPSHTNSKQPGLIGRTYLKVVKTTLAYPKWTLISAFAFLIVSFVLLMQLPTNFVDADDKEKITVKLETQPGSSLEHTLALARAASQIIEQYPEVQYVHTSVGKGGSNNIQTASLIATLSSVTSDDRRSQQELEALIRKQLKQIPGARMSIGGGEGQLYTIVLKSSDAGVLNDTAESVVKAIRQLPNMGNVISSANLMRPELVIEPDYDLAAQLGISTQAISDAIRSATAGVYEQNMPRLNLPNRQINVNTHLSERETTDLEFAQNIKVLGAYGAVPLSSVAKISIKGGAAQIDRIDRTRKISITVETLNRPLGDVQSEIEALSVLKSLPRNVERVNAGEAEQQKELFANFGFAMLAGILCVYAVLVLLFHDFLQPITILVALPLSAGGAFAALAMLGYSLSLSSLIGLIMLMGIVSKNSILLVEFAMKSQNELGMSRTEAIIDACEKRARPIVMTSFAMIAGMLPMALQLGVPSAFRGAMAVAVIGGLITSTALSLLVVPAVYELVDNIKRTLKNVFRVGDNHQIKTITQSDTI
jgi:multidrug efflux pump subunit AcrB